MTTQLRLLAGGTALAAGLLFLSAATAAPPALAKDAYKRAAEADIKFLQETTAELAANPGKEKVRIKPAKGVAIMVATYAEAAGDAELYAGAVKVAEAIGAKDYKGAADAAKALKAGAGGGSVKGPAYKQAKFDLAEGMYTFKPSDKGGLNIEKDIRDGKKGGMIDPKAAELLGTRTAVLADFTAHMPPEFGGKKKKEDWDRWSKQMGDLSKSLSEEGGKGAKADQKKLKDLYTKLDNNCTDCHGVFRDE